jgi:hypothetical protein
MMDQRGGTHRNNVKDAHGARKCASRGRERVDAAKRSLQAEITSGTPVRPRLLSIRNPSTHNVTCDFLGVQRHIKRRLDTAKCMYVCKEMYTEQAR